MTCSTANGNAESVSCSYDDGEIVEDCKTLYSIYIAIYVEWLILAVCFISIITQVL